MPVSETRTIVVNGAGLETRDKAPHDTHHPADGRPCCTRLVGLGVRLGTTTVLENVNLHIHCGEFTAIIGPNGAGKTTLLRALIGEVRHTGQLVFVPATGASAPRRPRVGYVPQRMEIDKTTPLTVLDLFAGVQTRRPVWLGHSRRIRGRARTTLERVRGEDLLDKRIGELSCGQLQRVLLALALAPVPELLLLDEPLAGMDHRGTLLFYRVVSEIRRAMDLSILLVSHDLAAAAGVADRLVFLNRTVLADGSAAQVLRFPPVRETFGLDLAGVTPMPTTPPAALLTRCRVPEGKAP
jgi:zinc transport system ATP-binding protein